MNFDNIFPPKPSKNNGNNNNNNNNNNNSGNNKDNLDNSNSNSDIILDHDSLILLSTAQRMTNRILYRPSTSTFTSTFTSTSDYDSLDESNSSSGGSGSSDSEDDVEIDANADADFDHDNCAAAGSFYDTNSIHDQNPNENQNQTQKQCECPFVTPSLVCSNEDAFSSNFIMTTTSTSASTSASANTSTTTTTPTSTATTSSSATSNTILSPQPSSSPTNNTNNSSSTSTSMPSSMSMSTSTPTSTSMTNFTSTFVPSIVGTNIDTALQLLLSVQMIELDYYPNPPPKSSLPMLFGLSSSSSGSSSGSNSLSRTTRISPNGINGGFGGGGGLGLEGGGGGEGSNSNNNASATSIIPPHVWTNITSINNFSMRNMTMAMAMGMGMGMNRNANTATNAATAAAAPNRNWNVGNRNLRNTRAWDLLQIHHNNNRIRDMNNAIAAVTAANAATTATNNNNTNNNGDENGNDNNNNNRNQNLLRTLIVRRTLRRRRRRRNFDADRGDTAGVAGAAGAAVGTTTNTTNDNTAATPNVDSNNETNSNNNNNNNNNNTTEATTTRTTTTTTATSTTATTTTTTTTASLRNAQLLDLRLNARFQNDHQGSSSSSSAASGSNSNNSNSDSDGNSNNENWIHVLNEERNETISQLTHLVLDDINTNNNTNTKTSPTTLTTNTTINTDTDINKYKPKSVAKSALKSKYAQLPRKICQHPFKKNDIVWVCRTCQADETCVLCHYCFTHSDHEGHDVAFYHAQAGGCCDCGDEDAWDPRGFCHLHGGSCGSGGSGGGGGKLDKDVECKVRGVVKCCVEYIGLFANSVELGYERANGGRIILEEDDNADTGGCRGKDSHSSPHSQRRRTSLSGIKRKNDKPHSSSNDEEESDDNDDIDVTMEMEGNSRNCNPNEVNPVGCENGNRSDAGSNSNTNSTRMDVDVTSVAARRSSVSSTEEFKFDPEAASTSKSRSPDRSPASNFHNTDRGDQNNDEAREKDHMAMLDHKFNPEAASTSKSRSSKRSPIRKKKSLHHHKRRGHRGPTISPTLSQSHQLGLLGLQEDGLYLILHADDIHDRQVMSSALKDLFNSFASSAASYNTLFSSPFSISLDSITKIIPLLFHQKDGAIGDIIVWGTFELMEELGPVLSQCWNDGDALACSRFGALMLDKARILRERGLVVSIKTRLELCREVRALAVLEFLKILSDSCDPLCNLVSAALGGKQEDEAKRRNKNNDSGAESRHLVSMLNSDLKLPRMIAREWHDLLLKLLAVPDFKAALSNAYVDTYSKITGEYARGIGILDKSSFTLSVQFLNRVTYVQDLVKKRDLLGTLTRSLLEAMEVAKLNASSDLAGSRRLINSRLDITHPIIIHRRYMPCISDLKCILNVPGIARLFSSIPNSMKMNILSSSKLRHCLDAWIEALAAAQKMDSQKWRSYDKGHVEVETIRLWVGAFNASISLGSLFERLLMWNDEDCDVKNIEEFSMTLLNAVELTQYILISGVAVWQNVEMSSMNSFLNIKSPELSCPACLPMSTIAVKHGCPLAINAMPVAQSDGWSFHLPLHRFLAACLREVVRRPNQLDDGATFNGIEGLFKSLKMMSNNEKQNQQILNGLIEFPTIILSRTAQIRSKLWRRNGQGMMDQVLNYAEPSFCRSLRDADLMLVQFALIGYSYLLTELNGQAKASPSQLCACSHFICLLTHRFGVFDFVGFRKAPNVFQEKFVKNRNEGIYPQEKGVQASAEALEPFFEDEALLDFPWTYSPTNDPQRLSSLLDELLQLLIILITELPPPPPKDEAEHLRQAKQRLRREVVHRLVSGSKAHSDLAEVHHVLPLQDNVALSEEGKFVNPEDATGAALEAVLVEVADCKSILGKSDRWELQRWAWNEYDPSFFHISIQSHQNAAENRPVGTRAEPFPYAPFPPPAHKTYLRLRRDVSSDSNVAAILYRVLHVHFCDIDEMDNFNSDPAYDKGVHSEIILGRVIHLLTLGAYAWETTAPAEKCSGGRDSGSVFYGCTNEPDQQCWVESILLGNPKDIMMSEDYHGQETMLEFINIISKDGGSKRFQVQDKSIRAGAAWLCEFATRCSPKAAILIGRHMHSSKASAESDLQRRKREAKERAMKQIQAKMMRFAEVIKTVEDVELMDTDQKTPENPSLTDDSSKTRAKENFSNKMSKEDVCDTTSLQDSKPCEDFDATNPTNRLLQDRPRCIICGDDSNMSKESFTQNDKTSNEKSPKVLAFCCLVQPSVTLKGCGGLTSNNDSSTLSLVGTHMSLCGHAVHTSCLSSHLKDQIQGRLGDRLEVGKRAEFKCPLCRRLSNCLVPFIDVGRDWVGNCEINDVEDIEEKLNTRSRESGNLEHSALHNFLTSSRWWAIRNDKSIAWNGRCSFIQSDSSDTNEVNIDFLSPKKRTKSFGKKDLYKAWTSVMSAPSFMRRGDSAFSDDSVSMGIVQPDGESSSVITDIWRRVLDQIADVSYKADIKRLGEQRLFLNFGEFRHYLVEKAVFNEQNRMAGIEPTLWPACMMMTLPSEMRSELSREKLVSKLFLTIQTLTYSYCAEEVECKRQSKFCLTSDRMQIMSKYGISKITCNGNLLVMPKPLISEEGGKEIFNGIFGRLRYFALSVMIATSPLSLEVVQLSLCFPEDPDPNTLPKEETYRAPIVYPILCGHILTHVVAAMCASCGKERALSDCKKMAPSFLNHKNEDILGDDVKDSITVSDSTRACLSFIQLGYIAKVLQTILGHFQQENRSSPFDWFQRERQVLRSISEFLDEKFSTISAWEKCCCKLLSVALHADSSFGETKKESSHKTSEQINANDITYAFKVAKIAGYKYLCSACLMLQVLIPFTVSKFDSLDPNCEEDELYKAMDISLDEMLGSHLVQHIIVNWYKVARPRMEKNELKNQLSCKFEFRPFDWPYIENEDNPSEMQASSFLPNESKTFPLLQSAMIVGRSKSDNPRIKGLPVSYTDLYADLGLLSPDTELTAVCLVCGEVLNAGGKGKCTSHAFQCGGGCGIFFLLQRCRGLLIAKEKAAFIPSPYVDSHGETPQFRGRPLFMDKLRYDALHELWSGHLIRDKVISERSKYHAYQLPENNYY